MTETPHRGDVVWLSMDPVEGHEQRGHRPHLTLSDERLASRMGLAIVVPMTSVERPWGTRVKLADGFFAIGEQPRTVSVSRITRIERRGFDVQPVVKVINSLIGE